MKSDLKLNNKSNHKLGLDAEEASQKHLISKGFKVLEKRYKTKHGEVDIIARNKTMLVFVEVKLRKNTIHDDPVSKTQKERIYNAALQYISEQPEISELDMRFDCIFIDYESRLNHIEDAWRQ